MLGGWGMDGKCCARGSLKAVSQGALNDFVNTLHAATLYLIIYLTYFLKPTHMTHPPPPPKMHGGYNVLLCLFVFV